MKDSSASELLMEDWTGVSPLQCHVTCKSNLIPANTDAGGHP